MDNDPLVSIIIPTFERADLLVRAVQSALNQTYINIEVIIIDDNMGDNIYRFNTRRRLEEEFNNASLTYIEHEFNKGLPAARNTGIEVAKGEFVAFLDDDDEWLSDKIAKQIELFQSLPENYGVVSCGWNLIDDVNQYSKEVFPNFRGDLSGILALNHFSPPSMILIKMEYLHVVNGFDEKFRWRQDVELYYRLSNHCFFDFVDEVLVNYHYHEGSMSRNFKQKLLAVNQFIQKHKSTLTKNKLPWSEIHERRGDLAAASGKLSTAVCSFLTAYVHRPKRIQILGKLALSFLGPSNYVKIRKL